MSKKFIKDKKDLKDFLSYEKKKYRIKAKDLLFKKIRENNVLWKHNYLLRKSEYHFNVNNKLRFILYKIRLKKFQIKNQIFIPLNSFDKGLKIMHLGPILVNGRVKGGKDISLHTGTSIVANGSDDGVPTLGNGIVVGVGAVILGGIYIANNIAIGANSVVNKTFNQENITIAGVPAKKINDSGSNSWNLNIVE